MDSTDASKPWPGILQRYVTEIVGSDTEQLPRRIRRRFHGVEVTLWRGRVNVNSIEGWVENVRLLHYLRKWQADRGDKTLRPTTEDIYEIMAEADREETAQERKPFHVERMAANIARNGIQDPILVFAGPNGRTELWDGNRRFFGTKHIMRDPEFTAYRDQAQWIPVDVYLPSGDPAFDEKVKRAVITELNFVQKDHIPWPAFVKAGEINREYHKLIAEDPTDPRLSRMAKLQLAEEYGLKGWRVVDRWIKMYDLAMDFKEYQEEEFDRADVEVDLAIQDKFEYFDELSKAGVWGALKNDPDARDEVFRWLWDEKFQAFTDVRMVPKILADDVARRQANADDSDGVRRAIATVIANDPTRVKSKEAANEKIAQFALWLDTFKREDFRQLTPETLERLRDILKDVVSMLEGLLSGNSAAEESVDRG